MKIGVLASGSGSNLQALLDAQASGALGPARLVTVGANVAGCGALTRAEAAGVPTFVLRHGDFASRDAFDYALADALLGAGVQCVVLAGFMRVLGAGFLARFPAGVLNIHPALLPAFPGVNAQGQAFAHRVKFSGCTVHFVDAGVDTGPIIAQAVVPALEGDSEETLRARILTEEHRLLPLVVRAHAEGRVRRDGRTVRVDGAPDLAGAAARLRSL